MNETPFQETGVSPLRLSRNQCSALLKALADPRRMDLVERLSSQSCPVGCMEVRASVKISAATLSHHIRELEAAGAVHVEREGKFAYLSLRSDVIAALAESLAALAHPPCSQK